MDVVVNGEPRRFEAGGSGRLLELLREEFGLTGTKFGCESRSCGACTVLIGDRATLACAVEPASVAGGRVTTIEGLADGPAALHVVQQAFLDEQVGQCGWCTPAQVLTAVALLREVADPGVDLIRERLSAVLCRCGTYQRAFAAVTRAAAVLAGQGEAE
uniref:(2Fe-2S)-binding protein n=1 Tax=Paractinoplanes polyasparticus TaxID=2856853 RepID=UPI001C863013|nr:2Fe-2S iron-sulfur cluster-binding protein [Actinoplanes polyasparticus]